MKQTEVILGAVWGLNERNRMDEDLKILIKIFVLRLNGLLKSLVISELRVW